MLRFYLLLIFTSTSWISKLLCLTKSDIFGVHKLVYQVKLWFIHMLQSALRNCSFLYARKWKHIQYFPKCQITHLKSAFVLSGVQTECKVSRKYSLGSSVDLVRAQSCPYAATQTNWIVIHSRTNDTSSHGTHIVWVSIISCRWSWGRICFARAFCPACSKLIKNIASLPPAPSSARWMRTKV